MRVRRLGMGWMVGFLRVLNAQCWSESTFPLEFVSGSARKATESTGSSFE